MKPESYAVLPITSKALDARRRGATTEAYGAILRKEERSLARLRREGNAAHQIPSWRGDDALMVDQGCLLPVDTIIRRLVH
jgi:cation transport ATPase